MPLADSTAPIGAPARCSECGTELGPSVLECPGCRRLVHAIELRRLAGAAAREAEAGDLVAAMGSWRLALELLPPGTRQHVEVAARIAALGRRQEAAQPAAAGAASGASPGKPVRRGLVGLGALGLLIWKFKFVLVFLGTKAKLLLLGLTKASTLLSMLLSMGVYWTLWGWKFAVGLVLSMYVHEMGHVAALRRHGIAATAPMFIPGLGAFVRLKQYPVDGREDARVGLAGPLWGLGAAVTAYLLFVVTGLPIFAAVARVGAWINIFNLLPLGSLDGGRGFRALDRGQRWWAVGAIGAAWFLTGESLLVLLLIVGGIRALGGQPAPSPDRRALLEYVLLVVALAALCGIEVPGAATAR